MRAAKGDVSGYHVRFGVLNAISVATALSFVTLGAMGFASWTLFTLSCAVLICVCIEVALRNSALLGLFCCWVLSCLGIYSYKRALGMPASSWRAELVGRIDLTAEVAGIIAGIALMAVAAGLLLRRPAATRIENIDSVAFTMLGVLALLLLYVGSRDSHSGNQQILEWVGVFAFSASAISIISLGRNRRNSWALFATGAIAILATLLGFRYIAWYMIVVFVALTSEDRIRLARAALLSFFLLYPIMGAVTSAGRQLGFDNLNPGSIAMFFGAHEENLMWQFTYFLTKPSMGLSHVSTMLWSILPNSGLSNSSAVLLAAMESGRSGLGGLNLGAFFPTEGFVIGGWIGLVAYGAIFFMGVWLSQIGLTDAEHLQRPWLIGQLIRGGAARGLPLLALSWAFYGFTNSIKLTAFIYILVGLCVLLSAIAGSKRERPTSGLR